MFFGQIVLLVSNKLLFSSGCLAVTMRWCVLCTQAEQQCACHRAVCAVSPTQHIYSPDLEARLKHTVAAVDNVLTFLPLSFLSSRLTSVPVPASRPGRTSQHADVLFLHRHGQRDGVVDESHDGRCAGASGASQEVCKRAGLC